MRLTSWLIFLWLLSFRVAAADEALPDFYDVAHESAFDASCVAIEAYRFPHADEFRSESPELGTVPVEKLRVYFGREVYQKGQFARTIKPPEEYREYLRRELLLAYFKEIEVLEKLTDVLSELGQQRRSWQDLNRIGRYSHCVRLRLGVDRMQEGILERRLKNLDKKPRRNEA